ncbi:hypothetical protein Tsubulata_043343 [Turnera subulata]|uniref:F-box domain-containing protein n=1 Tax=Turnera subulata TaxID=218843 RepID=A0A9Q0FJI8_9ROSI|nr:hypothetical protein Tsubulata_043343 [Turnera subulata]
MSCQDSNLHISRGDMVEVKVSEKIESAKSKSSQLQVVKQLNDVITSDDDLLIQILARLPVKSLLRFKSVSNRWLSLISSPEFCRKLYPDHHSVSGIFLPATSPNPDHYDFISLEDNPDSAPFESLTFVDDPLGITILQSCHGLFLCCTSTPRSRPEIYDFYVYNPTTKLFITLPHPGHNPITNQLVPLPGSNRERPRYIHGLNLAFDPRKSPHYKVVCIRSPDSMPDIDIDDTAELAYQIEIYSSKTRSWSRSGAPFVVRSNALFNKGVFCNGAIHWIGTWGSCLYFNIEEEQLGEMPMPPVPEDWEERRYVYFGESRGHLHLVEIYRSPTTHFDVYEMEKDCSCWFVKYRVDLDAIVSAFPRMARSYSDPSDLNHYVFDILSVEREAKDDESHILLHVPCAIVSYNLKKKTFKKICDFASQSVDVMGTVFEGSFRMFRWWGLYKFVESFHSV